MERIQYLINEAVTFLNRDDVEVTSQFCDALYYDTPQSQSVYDTDKQTRIDAWIAVQQAPLPPDPDTIYQITSDDGTIIQI